MKNDVYKRLAQHLDDLPPGYPPSESGVELRILRKLFTPEEAELATHLSLIEEEARVIARRAKISVEEAARRLEEMEKKGLVYVKRREGKEPQYQATGYVIGFYEFQVNRLTPDIIEDFDKYRDTWFDLDDWGKAPQLRTIPVGESIDVKNEILPYEKAEEILQDQKKIVVAPCVCRREREIAGNGCSAPSETCLVFGSAADYYLHNGLGHEISREEALQILSLAEETGLVLQPGNSKRPSNICACCGCCCGVLKSLNQHPTPAALVATPFYAVIDTEICDACGTCLTRCQMDAISLDYDYAVMDRDRCIGCGLCVTTCTTEALSLERKPESEQPYVPKNLADTNIRLAQARGKLGVGKMVGMLVKSKVDRVLAAR